MSAHPDLFAPPAEEPLQPDLRMSTSWHSIDDPSKPGQQLPFVVESFCGRYTITWSVPAGADANQRVFLAWRRHPLVEGRKPMPSLIGRGTSAREARQLCASHAEVNP